MAETFLEALARLRGGQAAGATPLPTGYSQIQVPQGTLRDADTRTTPTGEVLRTAGINAPELMTQDHKQLIRHGAVVVDEKPKAPARSRKAPVKQDPEGETLGE
jgi:hypothetical protein